VFVSSVFIRVRSVFFRGSNAFPRRRSLFAALLYAGAEVGGGVGVDREELRLRLVAAERALRGDGVPGLLDALQQRLGRVQGEASPALQIAVAGRAVREQDLVQLVAGLALDADGEPARLADPHVAHDPGGVPAVLLRRLRLLDDLAVVDQLQPPEVVPADALGL